MASCRGIHGRGRWSTFDAAIPACKATHEPEDPCKTDVNPPLRQGRRRSDTARVAVSPADANDVYPGRRMLLLFATIAFAIGLCWASLLFTSEPLPPERQEQVDRAIALVEQAGFTRRAALLRHVTSFRATDNWWNHHLGHREAYAATNFPFEVVTLYEPFFANTRDDVERAVILLHESSHLLGSGEEVALRMVWRDKGHLGWTGDRYADTRLWRNTREWTSWSVPGFFECGADGRSDCFDAALPLP